MRPGTILLSVVMAMCITLIASDAWCGRSAMEWLESYGAEGSDAGASVRQTTDGGYVFVGTTDSFGAGETDVWLVKTDMNGKEEWSRTFGGELADMGKAVRQTDDGGYIITGATRSYGAGKRDLWLIKTDPLGNEEWSRTFGGPGWDYGRSVEQADDGGYIVTGYTDSFGMRTYDIWLIKTDAEGYSEWQKTYGGELADYGYCVQQTSDGGYIVTGESASFGSGNYDVWVIKTDTGGNMEWDSLFGGPGADRGRYGIQTLDGGYIVTGYTTSFGAGSEDAWLIKIDAEGNMEWDKTFGGPDSDRARVVIQTDRGGYLFAGYTSSFGRGLDDMWVVETGIEGDSVWSRTFGRRYFYDRVTSVVQTNDRDLVVLGQSRPAGSLDYDTFILELNITR